MRYLILGGSAGTLLYALFAIRAWVTDRTDTPDERIRSLARIGGWVFRAFVCWHLFDYFVLDRQSPAVLLIAIGVLGGFQLAAEVHWHVSVGRHLRREKRLKH